ncbi:MAG: helix-turn-helix domain-containing protein [Solirubrobacteraceae bacterium]|jgi:excisionase family DNA binding protein
MTPLATIPLNHARRTRPGASQFLQRTRRTHPGMAGPARLAIPEPTGRAIPGDTHPFSPLIDAKAASQLLGVPHTWLLAQARERRIPHHRLGHYVRFNPEDLQEWLKETRSMPHDGHFQARRRRL